MTAILATAFMGVSDRRLGAADSLRTGVGTGLRALLVHLATRAPARVFVLEGADPGIAVAELRLHRDLRLVESPRSAMVLLVVGRVPHVLHEAAQRAHDAMAHPRATVCWGHDAAGCTLFPDGVHIPAAEGHAQDRRAAVAATLVRVQSELLRGIRTSEPALLPDVDPAPWRGVGPFGQGGAGMTGGVPYGRPMTGRAADRDGLELDQLPVRVGPFFAPFPAGLILDVKLQGDVVQEVVVPGNAFATGADMEARVAPDRGHYEASLPLVVDVERERARHHLRWLAHALRVHGLEALARRTLALSASLAHGTPPDARTSVASLGRLLERSRTLDWATAEVGVMKADLLAGRGLGPVARAAGIAEDARLDDRGYSRLAFEPIVARPGGVADARARWRQRLGEVLQSLDLSAQARTERAGADGVAIEGCRGRQVPNEATLTSSGVLLAMLPTLLQDQEWGDAVTTVVSLDIDIREAGPGAAPLTPAPAPGVSKGMGGMGNMPGRKPPPDGAGEALP